MEIRKAMSNDAEDIARIHVESWRTTYAGVIPDLYLRELSIESRKKTWNDAIIGKEGQKNLTKFKHKKDFFSRI